MSDYTGPGIYTLVNVATGTVANLAGANPANGSAVIAWENVVAPNSTWQIAAAGGDQFFIINGATGTYMAAKGGSIVCNLALPTDKTAKWTIVPAGNGAYLFYNVATPTSVVNLSGAQKPNGTPIILYPETKGAANEQWYIKLPTV